MIGYVLAAIVGYMLGSIPFGLLITRAAGLGDVRKIGSGNIGATNVLRTGRRELAAATLILDALKGAIAVIVARYFWPGDAIYIAAIAVFLGHCFPVWLGFKGGKGVASFLGVSIALYWPAGLLVAATWLAAAFVWRISSLAALVAIALSPIYFIALGQPRYAMLALVLAILIFFMHRQNIARLRQGSEPRIGRKNA